MAEEFQPSCPDGDLAALAQLLQTSDEQGLVSLRLLIKQYPWDSRLHFLEGSVLAGQQRYDEGRAAMAKALEIEPNYALARFQLGFLDFSSGRAAEAIGVWASLERSGGDDALKHFVAGLKALAAEDYAVCIRLLEEGVELNTEYPIISSDMQLIIDELRAKGLTGLIRHELEQDESSAAQQLLWQHSLRGTKH
jgi:tetratricopeptide (TPR) repeat protein